jgi:hypothetical protein
MSNAIPDALRTGLQSELKKIYIRTLLLRLTAGFVAFLAVGAWIALALVIWTAATDAPALWHTLTVVRVAGVALAALFIVFVVVPVVRMPRFRQLAKEVEEHKDFKDIVQGGYEFASDTGGHEQYSQALIREVIRQALQYVSELKVRFLFLTRGQLRYVPVAYAGLVVLVLIALTSPATILNTLQRVGSPRSASAIERQANLYGAPGNVTVLAGNDVEVTAIDMAGADAPVTVSYNLAEGFWKTEKTERSDIFVDPSVPVPQYTYTFEDVRNSLTYYFQSGDKKSPEYRITVVNKPIVTELTVTVTPPEYTGEPSRKLVDSGGNVQALEGTEVHVAARSNNALSGAWVRFDEEQREVEFEGHDLAFDFRALEDGTYGIVLEDELGYKTDEPLAYSIEVYKDNAPVLDVLEPGEDATLPRNSLIDVSFIASDDYGVAKAKIFYRKGGEDKYRGSVIPLEESAGERDIAKSFTWDLSQITLFPGNYVEYFLQVEDNNVVTGPGITKSRVFQVSVPTMAELYESIDEEDSKRSDLFEEARRESEALKERMEKLSREFKKTEKLDWSQKKEVDKAIASQEAIQEKIDEIQQSLEETMQSLSDNEMTSQQIGEKLEAIQKLIEDINDEALNKYVEELRKAMEKLNPDDIQDALENLELTAEEFMRSLERTESLLKEIQREELVRNAQELMNEQERVADETAETDAQDSERMNELAEDQEGLAGDTDDVQKAMEELAEQIANDAQTPEEEQLAEEMKQAAEEMSQNQTSGKMRKASQNMQQGEQQQAKEQQEQAMNDLIGLFTRTMQMQMSMESMSQNRTAENLQRLARNTLELSFKQEQLSARLQDQVAGEDVANVRALALEQLTYVTAVQQIADELHEISKHAVEVPPSLLEGLGETIQNMQNALLFLEQNKAFMSTASASQSVTNLNLITMELLTACQACQQGGGSGQAGQQSRLQQLLSGQKQMMQQSQELLQMRAAQEMMLQEQQAAMQRLHGQQRSLQDVAKDIQEDVKDNDRVLGRMDKIIDEMEEVIRDLESGNLTEDTMRKEQRILSRLLDANRSVHTRDYEKKRESVSARDLYSDTAGGTRNAPTSQQLREEIRRAMSLKAPGEFEDLIRLYFRALAEEAPASAR